MKQYANNKFLLRSEMVETERKREERENIEELIAKK